MNVEQDTETAAANGQQSHSKFNRLTEQLMDHLETRWEYVVLTFTEKSSEVISSIISILTAGVFGLLVLLFLSIGFAFWLGDQIDSRAGGFALAGLIFIPIGAAAYYFLKPFLRAKIIQNILQDDDLSDQG